MTSTYTEIMEGYAHNMGELQCSIQHQAAIVERQGKVLYVNAVLISGLYGAIVVNDDMTLAVAMLQDYMEAPPTGVN